MARFRLSLRTVVCAVTSYCGSEADCTIGLTKLFDATSLLRVRVAGFCFRGELVFRVRLPAFISRDFRLSSCANRTSMSSASSGVVGSLRDAVMT